MEFNIGDVVCPRGSPRHIGVVRGIALRAVNGQYKIYDVMVSWQDGTTTTVDEFELDFFDRYIAEHERRLAKLLERRGQLERNQRVPPYSSPQREKSGR